MKKNRNLVTHSKRPKRSSRRRLVPAVDTAKVLSDLVNMTDDGTGYFRKRWKYYHDYSDAELLAMRDELRLLWGLRVEEEDGIKVTRLMETKRTGGVITVQGHESQKSLPQVICEGWLVRPGWEQFVVQWDKARKRILPNPINLPVVLAFGCVEHADHLRFCWNPDCPQPYFLAGRRDQKFCSASCAEPAKRESKRRWWRENRGETG